MRPQILFPAKKCTLGCPVLDQFLAGGVPCGSITELSGESGSGKTQLALQLLLSAQLPLSLGGLASSSLYLHSEPPYPFRRFEQLSKAFYLSYHQVFDSVECVCNNVLVQELDSADHLFDVLLKLDSMLAEDSRKTMPIRLVVIDSIAALFRSEFENTPFDLRRRANLFFKISSKLKLIAMKYGVAVLVTNQVVDVMRSSGDLNALRIGNFDSLFSSGRRVCPALGISWASCVNSRLFLSMNEEIVGNVTDDGDDNLLCRRTKREMHVVFAPHLPSSSREYVINREGVFGVRGQIETSVSGTSFKSDTSKNPTFLLCDKDYSCGNM
ncbi:X-ray repair cross complementing 3 (XRCC3) [Heracleum sosnowskyi]|uniref:X-ray repair cross complementing 3 (XRCC3) n=1 Tax=Heracleum sosnowskyi TaxID=360622 RepID=A0AAD8ILU8_9APIA|nr:X-ray repair cross complementing 3 (XRCC3) [Heracleum sosnowskyi]